MDRIGLTVREKEVLPLMVRGLSYKDIADELGITYRTAQAYVSSIMQKLGVESRGRAVYAALILGLFVLDDAERAKARREAPND